MKTQINSLRSGIKNQLLNRAVDYSQMPPATSHIGHGGTNHEITGKIFRKVLEENPDVMTIEVMGKKYEMNRNKDYFICEISGEDVKKFGVSPKKGKTGLLTIQGGSIISVYNGGKGSGYLCPSFITIL